MRINKFIQFNENVDFNENLLDFCKNHLPYLIDNNIDIDLYIESEEVVEIAISNPNDWIYFSKIKDEFIQFLSLLDRNFNIISINIESVTRTHKYSVDEIFNDKDKYGKNIIDVVATIAIYIKK